VKLQTHVLAGHPVRDVVELAAEPIEWSSLPTVRCWS
jgi:hypothetical protein